MGIKSRLFRLVKRALRPLSDRWVYTARQGLVKGMRLRGGFLFLPSQTVPKEEHLLQQIASSLTGKVVYDIGANVGIITLFFARCVGENGLVVACEPVPSTAARLKENVRLNRLNNVRIYEYAIGDTCGEFEIGFTQEAIGIATLNREVMKRYEGSYRLTLIPVKTITLDELIRQENLPYPHFIKIDVEGFEYQVLKGASTVLSEAHPQIFLEIHGANRENYHANVYRLYDLLEQYGYNIQTDEGVPITRERLPEVRGLWYCV